MAEKPNRNRAIRIDVRNLEVAYEDFVALHCDRISTTGNIVAVVGHNGAGKSTFIKTLLGLLRPQSGTLTVTGIENGTETLYLPEEHMAFCPETGSVFADITVENYVRLWCRVKRHDGGYYKKGGSDIVEMLNLAPLFSKLGRELSKGQRRRVQTAIGFLSNPKFFLFDEPFDGLDVQKTHELTDIVTEYSDRMSFMISSHRMDVVERLADIIIVLQDGAFLSCGSCEDVCRDLCKQSVLISNVSDASGMLGLLRQEFPTCLINRIGEEIALTGPHFEMADLQRFLSTNDPNGIRVRESKPRLVDAMNYHLRDLETRSS